MNKVETINDLTQLSTEQLYSLYRTAKTPEIEDFEGKLYGQILLLPGIKNFPGYKWIFPTIFQNPLFPWKGKVFRTLKENSGECRDVYFFDKFKHHYEVSIAPSFAGDFETLQLINKSTQQNSKNWRAELREVAPGLWLGLAYEKRNNSPYMNMYFALQRSKNIKTLFMTKEFLFLIALFLVGVKLLKRK